MFFAVFFHSLWIIVAALKNGLFITSLLHLQAQIFRFIAVPKSSKMISYLLLRSNRESGPYSLEELLGLGLKPYDLVWVKGKSAAWRYPSEIEELKPYAPSVEEQPFDRFYKKPVAAKAMDIPTIQESAPKTQEIGQTAQVELKPVPETVKPLEESAYLPKIDKVTEPVYIPKKSVFVTMPGQQTVAVTPPEKKPQPVVEKLKATPIGVDDDEVASQFKYSQPAAEKLKVTPIALDDDEVASQVKYSQPLDEIKEMYVKTLQERKTKIARKSVMTIYARRAAVVIGLIGLGVLAGFIIKPKSNKEKSVLQQVTALPANVATSNDVPEQSKDLVTDNTAVAQQDENSQPIVEKPRPIESVIPGKRRASILDRPITSPQQPATVDADPEKHGFEEKQLFAGAEKNSVTGERTRSMRENGNTAVADNREKESIASKATGKSGLEGQVAVTSNDYKRVAFGGIRDLRLTVTNNSKFELDNVIVELQYLKPSEQPLKTENVEFKFIGPNESSTIRIPDTNRGIKVAYKILSIGSKQARDGVAGM